MLYVCLCSFSSYFMCVRFVIQTIGREMILHERKRKSTPNGECGKNLLRESRLTWKNSSRNIWIEICVNGCECECDVLNQRKLQLVQSLKTYSSRYVPVRAHNYSMQHSIQPSSRLVAFYAYKTRSLSLSLSLFLVIIRRYLNLLSNSDAPRITNSKLCNGKLKTAPLCSKQPISLN